MYHKVGTKAYSRAEDIINLKFPHKGIVTIPLNTKQIQICR